MTIGLSLIIWGLFRWSLSRVTGLSDMPWDSLDWSDKGFRILDATWKPALFLGVPFLLAGCIIAWVT